MSARPRIAVVGAGIGGLTLAAALRERGLPCRIFEQARRLTEVGAGVQLAPNAVRPLRELGLGARLARSAVPIDAMETRSWAGEPLARTPFGEACEQLFGAPYYAVHRADLQSALLDTVGPGPLRLGRTLKGVVPEGDAVRLEFEDGSTHHADLVVGADGIHSVVRRGLVADAPVFSGLGVYRGLVPVADLPAAAREPRIRMWLGPGRHFVCYPVRGGELLSFAAIAPQRDAPVESWSAEGSTAELAAAFPGWRGLIHDVIGATRSVRRWALYDREALPVWAAGRVTVLGDAAHPMLPFLAQGANQAVEDAVDLACRLAATDTAGIPAALVGYQAARRSRTAAIQHGARGHSDSMHLPDGPSRDARDLALRRSSGLDGLRGRAWLYGHRAEPDPTTTDDSLTRTTRTTRTTPTTRTNPTTRTDMKRSSA
ncbi:MULTISPECIES: FAD-dependent monooxygenase [unclassified Streptomyces]|uniref:FAD-dependent monooxygenase n=1 Tax=unclassified Streptomyces TaxID=2593676 RepID=UPI001370BC77|nr:MULTISPECIES: FAD-dependent monooxygenase [unclassified Streptomyces]MYY82681.1 NAD(P)-binding protein [Streptomyces sp. SID335]MYZ13364.1 NAD(P)-binding protein [Streptomyces sp. SID337]NDZ89272.1 NAD(P)-binding protein [Streptomyces sp. SID10115]NEB49740.1 NAD(P)-binding protein [Streptomyces sp. SID339]